MSIVARLASLESTRKLSGKANGRRRGADANPTGVGLFGKVRPLVTFLTVLRSSLKKPVEQFDETRSRKACRKEVGTKSRSLTR